MTSIRCALATAFLLAAATEAAPEETGGRQGAYGLKDIYLTYIEQVKASASPIPDQVRVRMHRLVGKRGIPFTHQDIENARYVQSTSAAGKLLFPATYGVNKVAGITHDQLIVVLPEVVAAKNCRLYAVWAHELTHVAQNREDGRMRFLNTYLADATKYNYREIPYEAAAYKVEIMVTDRYCNTLERAENTPNTPSRKRQ